MTIWAITPDGAKYQLPGPQVPRRGDEVALDGYGRAKVQQVEWRINVSTDETVVRLWLEDWRAE